MGSRDLKQIHLKLIQAGEPSASTPFHQSALWSSPSPTPAPQGEPTCVSHSHPAPTPCREWFPESTFKGPELKTTRHQAVRSVRGLPPDRLPKISPAAGRIHVVLPPRAGQKELGPLSPNGTPCSQSCSQLFSAAPVTPNARCPSGRGCRAGPSELPRKGPQGGVLQASRSPGAALPARQPHSRRPLP